MSIQARLCVNTFSQTHADKAAIREHYVGLDMTNSLCVLQMWRMLHKVWQYQSPSCGTKKIPYFLPEPEPYARTTTTNGDHYATAETPTAATATTATATTAQQQQHDT